MRRFLTAFAAAVLMLSLGTADAAEYKKMTIRAATANPQGSLHVVAIDKFKEIVEKESNGAITVQTFYGGSLGDEQANVKQLRNAEIHLAVLADGNLTPFAPQAGVFILPYMFPKISDAEKLFGNEAFMNKTADAIAKQSRTRPLSWLVGGYRIITNSKKPINTMADLKGLTVGSQIGITGVLVLQEANVGAKIKEYDDIGLAFEDLAAGRVDAVICDDPVAKYYANKRTDFAGKFGIAYQHNNPEYFGFCVRKGETELVKRINKAIAAMKASEGAFLLEVRVEGEENIFPMGPAGAPVSEIRFE